jgi:hypothetical protein
MDELARRITYMARVSSEAPPASRDSDGIARVSI